MSITIYGYSSFKEWADAGFPGAVDGNTGMTIREPDSYTDWMKYKPEPKVKVVPTCIDCGVTVYRGPRCHSCGYKARGITPRRVCPQCGGGSRRSNMVCARCKREAKRLAFEAERLRRIELKQRPLYQRYGTKVSA